MHIEGNGHQAFMHLKIRLDFKRVLSVSMHLGMMEVHTGLWECMDDGWPIVFIFSFLLDETELGSVNI